MATAEPAQDAATGAEEQQEATCVDDGATWAFNKIDTVKQRDGYNCGVVALRFAIGIVTGVQVPTVIGGDVLRSLLLHRVVISDGAVLLPLPITSAAFVTGGSAAAADTAPPSLNSLLRLPATVTPTSGGPSPASVPLRSGQGIGVASPFPSSPRLPGQPEVVALLSSREHAAGLARPSAGAVVG